MSNSLINTAMSGLNAAQVALSTVSNKISNYNVVGLQPPDRDPGAERRHGHHERFYRQRRDCHQR